MNSKHQCTKQLSLFLIVWDYNQSFDSYYLKLKSFLDISLAFQSKSFVSYREAKMQIAFFFMCNQLREIKNKRKSFQRISVLALNVNGNCKRGAKLKEEKKADEEEVSSPLLHRIYQYPIMI